MARPDRPGRLGRSRGAVAGAVVVLGLAAGAVSVEGPVSAEPPSDSDPPPDQPAPTRPPRTPTTSTPPPTTPRVLEGLGLSADSVVVKATVLYNGAPGLVTVEWGDGAVSARDPFAPSDSPRPNPNPDPPGVVTFRHTYAAPADGGPRGVQVTARIGAEAHTTSTVVTPRYRVTQYIARMQPLDRCDDFPESHTEWRVERSGAAPGRTWRFDLAEPDGWVGDYPGQTTWLPDSAVVFEGTAAEAGEVDYRVTELDPLIDDNGARRSVDLDPALGSRSVVLIYDNFSHGFPSTGNCEAEIRADVDVTLLTPGLGGGPIAHGAAPGPEPG